MAYEDRTANELMNELRDQFVQSKGFADTLRSNADPIWRRIDSHPFLVELENGKLPIEKYRTYAIQNYFYFAESFRSKSAAAVRAPTTAGALIFRDWASYIGHEFEKYLALLRAVGLTEERLKQATTDPTVPLPAARAYVDYVFKVYSTGSMGEIAACILPCAWSYSPRQIGGLGCPLRIAKGLADHYGVDRGTALSYGTYSAQKPHLLYLLSLKNYVTEEVKRESRETIDRIRDVFRRCSEYEYMWWDLAYRHDVQKDREIGAYY